MTKEDILHLGRLSRIALSEAEVEALATSIDSILEYVSVVRTMAGDSVATEPQVGVRYNVLRPDVITNEPGEAAPALLDAMPKREGRFLVVKKILNPSE
jgi:aspartyl-tRNA(Asn)/glutamyl-tRNA(Gln) amidotransferase subunit C